MKRSSNNPRMRQVLKEIVNRNSHEPEVKLEDAAAFLQRKIECLQAENKMLAQQLSKEIEAKQYLGRLLAQHKENNEKNKNKQEQAGLTKTQNPTKHQKRDGSACKLERNKSLQGYRKVSLIANTETEMSKLKQQVKMLEEQLTNVKKQYIRQQRKGKTFQQQILFIKQHLYRAKQENNDLEQEMQFSRSHIKQMKSLLTQQNSEILRLKLQIERANLSLIPQPLINISTLTLSPLYWSALKNKINHILSKNIKQVILLKKVEQEIIASVNQFQKAHLQQVNCE